MSIHNEHPFLPPEQDRNPVRRLRGRLASPVTVLTAEHAGARAGLTVSSVLVVDGEPGVAVVILDPLSDVHDAIRGSGRAVLNVLGQHHRTLADAFGYVAPAPGGPFQIDQWTSSDWGPVLESSVAWAGCVLASQARTEIGWGVQLLLTIESVTIGPDSDPLLHHRGRYGRLTPD